MGLPSAEARRRFSVRTRESRTQAAREKGRAVFEEDGNLTGLGGRSLLTQERRRRGGRSLLGGA